MVKGKVVRAGEMEKAKPSSNQRQAHCQVSRDLGLPRRNGYPHILFVKKSSKLERLIRGREEDNQHRHTSGNTISQREKVRKRQSDRQVPSVI